MDDTDPSIANEKAFHRRIMAELHMVPRVLFRLGALWCVLGLAIHFVPDDKRNWFIISMVLTAFGFLVPQWRYRIVALVLFGLSIFEAFGGHGRP